MQQSGPVLNREGLRDAAQEQEHAKTTFNPAGARGTAWAGEPEDPEEHTVEPVQHTEEPVELEEPVQHTHSHEHPLLPLRLLRQPPEAGQCHLPDVAGRRGAQRQRAVQAEVLLPVQAHEAQQSLPGPGLPHRQGHC